MGNFRLSRDPLFHLPGCLSQGDQGFSQAGSAAAVYAGAGTGKGAEGRKARGQEGKSGSERCDTATVSGYLQRVFELIDSETKLRPHDRAILHHKAHTLDGGNVVERVAGDGDDVSKVAGLELADLALPAEELGSFNHVSLQNR